MLGASIVGANAGELILPWVQMILARRKIKAMIDPVFPYPTLSEASKRAAMSNFATLASNKWVRRVVDVLAAFG